MRERERESETLMKEQAETIERAGVAATCRVVGYWYCDGRIVARAELRPRVRPETFGACGVI